MMEKLGLKTKLPAFPDIPYSDKLKHADGDNKNTTALIMHMDYGFAKHRYQSTSLEDLAKNVKYIE